MKILLPLLVMILLSSSMVFAQETPEVSDWKTEQRCIDAPSQPPDGWTYDGVIFTFKRGDGVHARRADMATPYYVAFDSDSEFGKAGSFSPDGKWLAVPEGRTSWTSMTFRKYTIVDELRIYSTAPNRMMFRIALREGSGEFLKWLDENRLLISAFIGKISSHEGQFIFNVVDQSVLSTTHPFDAPTSDISERLDQLREQIPTLPSEAGVSFSPDGQILAFRTDTLHIADLQAHTITDTCIHTPYSVAFSPDGKQVVFGLEPAGYTYILDLETWQAYRIDLAAADVVGWYPLEQGK